MKVVDINELKMKLDLADGFADTRRILLDAAFNTVPHYVVRACTQDKDIRLSLPQDYDAKDPDYINRLDIHLFTNYVDCNGVLYYRHSDFSGAIYTEDVLVLDNEGNVHQFDMHGKEHDVDVTSLSVPSTYYRPSRMTSSCIKKIIVPPSVRTISSYAFEGCGLESIQFHYEPHRVIIDEYAFKDCQSLKKLVLPKNVSFGSPNALRGSAVNELVFEDRTWDEVEDMLKSMDITHPGKNDTVMVTCCGNDEDVEHRIFKTRARFEDLDIHSKAV